jgi:hypothetical protein
MSLMPLVHCSGAADAVPTHAADGATDLECLSVGSVLARARGQGHSVSNVRVSQYERPIRDRLLIVHQRCPFASPVQFGPDRTESRELPLPERRSLRQSRG